jgi:hypothetical protein
MKVEVLLNGTTKIVLIPETPIEISILESVGKTEVEVMSITKGTAILNKVVPECLVISPKGPKEEVKRTSNEGAEPLA